MSLVLHPESDEEYNLILQSTPHDRLVVVDFYADWCGKLSRFDYLLAGPCKMIAPAVENLANFFTHVTFIKVDTDRLRVNC